MLKLRIYRDDIKILQKKSENDKSLYSGKVSFISYFLISYFLFVFLE